MNIFQYSIFSKSTMFVKADIMCDPFSENYTCSTKETSIFESHCLAILLCYSQRAVNVSLLHVHVVTKFSCISVQNGHIASVCRWQLLYATCVVWLHM